jgi:poly-gamma-glutamate system protein
MTIAFLALYYWSESSLVTVRPQDYQQRLDAANTMLKAMETLRDFRLPSINMKAVDGDDPLLYTLLGEKDSPITTDEGNIDDKITVLNPNYAAAMVDLLGQAGLQKGDTVAVMLTGSMPGANIAILSAINALNLNPVVITSVGSSWWGANSPDFSWLDMEHILANKGIFPYRSVAASLGGNDDQGGLRLSDVGRNALIEAADRNQVTLIKQGTLKSNIDARIEVFRRVLPIERYKAVINIGGGIAAMGHRENGTLIPTGINKRLPVVNYPARGVVHAFSDDGVQVIHIYDVNKIARDYSLPVAQLPIPRIGIGIVYEQQRYNLAVVGIAVALMLIILAVVKYYDRQQFKWREEGVDPDTLV